MNDDGSNNKKDTTIGTSDFSVIPSSSSTTSTSTTNSGATETEENRRENKVKPTTVDAETFTTKSLESETSSSSSSSSGNIPESDTELPHRVPRTSKPRDKAIAKKQQPLTTPAAEDQADQAEYTKEKKVAPGRIKFQTIPEETAAGIEDESAGEGEPKSSRHVRYDENMLKASKSHHVKRISLMDDDDDMDDESDELSEDSTNLRIGHVFVYMIMPPDGGYGWFIMLISFLCQVVVDGIMFAIGIILPYIAADLDIPPSQVVLVASMQIGFYFLSGAVSSAFINKYGFRPVALIGCSLAITVLSIATFSTNLSMMIFFYSFLGGPSLSMVWVSSQLIIGYYFDKFRPIANGISCSGAGAGIMIFSYMNSVLVPELGWRNLMRVHVGFLLIVLLMTFTFIEVAPTRIGRVVEFLDESDSESSGSSAELTKYTRFSLGFDNEEYPLHEDFAPIYERRSTTVKKEPNRCTKCLDKCCPAYQRWIEKRREKQAEEEAIRKYVIKRDLMDRDDLFYNGPKDIDKESELADQILKQRTASRVSESDDFGARRTITLDAFKSVHQKKSVISALSTMHMKRDEDKLKKMRKSYVQLKETEKYPLCAFLSPKNLVHPKIRRAFSLLFDFRLLAIMEFRILLLSAFLFPMGFNIPFVYSTVRVQIDQSFAKLITPTIGFSNFAFRIASGFIAFQFREYTTYICGGGMVFGGLAVLTSAFYGINVVWFQFVYAMCYGMAPAFYSTLRAIIYVRALGLDKLTNAFGLTALAMGLGVFIGTTAAGFLNDLTGTYTASFIFAGICICVSGGLKLLLPFLLKRPK